MEAESRRSATVRGAGEAQAPGVAADLRVPLRIRVSFDWDAFVLYLGALWRRHLVRGLKLLVLFAPLLLVGFALQAAIGPLSWFAQAMVCLPAVVVVFALYRHGVPAGVFVGLFAGILQDALAGTPLGVGSCAYACGLGLLLLACRSGGRSVLAVVLSASALLAALSVALPWVLLRVLGGSCDVGGGEMLRMALASGVFAGAILTPPTWYLILIVERMLGLGQRGTT